MAVGAAGTATVTPVQRAVNNALENLSLEEIGAASRPETRPSLTASDGRYFPPPDARVLEELKPRPTIVAYVVRRGDTVIKLASRYKVTPSTIVWANKLTDPDRLVVGQTLLILPMSGVLHPVSPSETIEQVADKYQIEPVAILDANGLTPGSAIAPATQLVIPGGRPLEPERAAPAIRPDGTTETGAAQAVPAETAPQPTQAASAKPIAYEVQPGDSVLSIARRFGISPGTVVQANGIAGAAADDLKVGQILRILPMDGVLHRVADGDMVRDLATRYGSDAGAIVRVNGLIPPFVLQPGQEIVIPNGRVPDAPLDRAPVPSASAPVAPPSSAPAAPLPSAPATEPTAIPYEIQGGDSVVSIAERFGLDPRAVARYNGLDRADLIAPGQNLLLPPGSRLLAAGATTSRAPAPSAPPPTEPTAIPYKIQEGDSVVSIAERFGLDPRIVARFNGLDRADVIAPGQNLLLPPGSRLVAAGAIAARVPDPPSIPAPAVARAPAAAVVPVVAPKAAAPPPAKAAQPSTSWDLVAVASKFLGYAYVWGGQSPRGGFDCTGFTWYVYQQVGRQLPLHDLWGQMQSGSRVSRSNLRAGDLVFFANTYMPGLSHVGIYIGGGRFIHAGSERTGVTVSSLSDAFWTSRYYGATRPA